MLSGKMLNIRGIQVKTMVRLISYACWDGCYQKDEKWTGKIALLAKDLLLKHDDQGSDPCHL